MLSGFGCCILWLNFGFWWVLDLWWLLAGFRVSWVSGFWFTLVGLVFVALVVGCLLVGGFGFRVLRLGFEWMLVVGDFGGCCVVPWVWILGWGWYNIPLLCLGVWLVWI